MSQPTVLKTVGGVTTKITTTTRTIKSSIQQQQHTQQQMQTQQKVITKYPQMGAVKDTKNKETGKENHIPVQHTQQQMQTQQKVITKSPQMGAVKDTKNKEAGKENHIPVKSNFSKSDTLEKKTQQQHQQQNDLLAPKIKPKQSRTEDVCACCNKTVYKMEEVIAEDQVWHKNCFRCKECDKPLNRHNKAEIHEGVVYCKFHFKQLFGPKTVEGADDEPKGKSELIIRENQPVELPDSVIRSSDKHDLGLEDIPTAAVKTRFQMFEKISTAEEAQRERPLNFDNNMTDIKNKFEAGMEQGREERRKERKQEIQDIRSRLFMGKQARTKEMYQNAVADLESTTKLRNKGFSIAHELDDVKATAEKARNIKQKFETGDVYWKSNPDNQEMFDEVNASKVSVTCQISNKVSERMQMLAKQQLQDGIVKSHVKVKDVATADISNQFEFFESYNPEEQKGKNVVKQQISVDEKHQHVIK